jgi:ATP-dependent DNA helicase DinG
MGKTQETENLLDPEELSFILKKDGLLNRKLDSFEERASQLHLLEDLVKVFNEDKVGLFEAGTGIGKTFAYLIPAIIWSLQNQEKVLISTHTIPLQEQLLKKDIPFLKKHLNLNLEASLVKGMNNYVCLRKLQEMQDEAPLFSSNLKDQVQAINSWAEETTEGSKSTLDFTPSRELWEKVAVDMDACNHHQCPFYKKCFFFKDRKKAQESQILIANHHIFFTDFFNNVLEDSDNSVFPPCDKVIFDEAHHLEDTAISRLSFKVSAQEIYKILHRIFSEDIRSSFKGCLSYLKERISRFKNVENKTEIKDLLNSLNFELPSLRREIELQSLDAFALLEELAKESLLSKGSSEEIYKLRLTEAFYSSKIWEEEIITAFKELISNVEKFTTSCFFIIEKTKRLFPPDFIKTVDGKLLDLKSLLNRLNTYCDLLKKLFDHIDSSEWVCWLEGLNSKSHSSSLHFTQLNVSNVLKEHFYPHFSSLAMLSATLSTDSNFKFIKKSMGINQSLVDEDRLIEKIYPSSFDYSTQAMLLCPTDLPSPGSPHFLPFANDLILEALIASQGRAFILFTSYAMLKSSTDFLVPLLEERGMECFIQGSAPRTALLDEFKEAEHGVLFGTDSFWEGVDVIGDKLQLVVITKLPFSVPTDPIVQARGERLAQENKSSFVFDSLPRAIVKFKQGFGRLIRSKTDKGCVICLDSRLVNKNYGRNFLSSLPNMQKKFGPKANLLNELRNFYQNL